MDHILSLFTYLLTTSVSGRVPGYPSYYPTGTRGYGSPRPNIDKNNNNKISNLVILSSNSNPVTAAKINRNNDL